MTAKCKYLVWLYWRKIRARPILSVLLLLLTVYIIAAASVAVNEGIGFGAACLQLFPSFFGEIGEIGNTNLAVRISIVVGILVSATFVVIVTARITSLLVDTLQRGGTMANKVNFDDHTIVCGWNFQGNHLVEQVLEANKKQHRGIVVVHDSSQRPDIDERAEFIHGDPSQAEILEAAGVQRANSVIVLTDFDKQMNDADAEVLMITLAVESLNRKVHTCVQIRNSANLMHLERAHADEVICLDQIGANVAVASALNHGVCRLLNELLTFNIGSEFYRYDKPLSDSVVKKEFAEVVGMLARQHVILIGIETDYSEDLPSQMFGDVLNLLPEGDRVIVVNPQSPYWLRQGDALFIIAESMPTHI